MVAIVAVCVLFSACEKSSNEPTQTQTQTGTQTGTPAKVEALFKTFLPYTQNQAVAYYGATLYVHSVTKIETTTAGSSYICAVSMSGTAYGKTTSSSIDIELSTTKDAQTLKATITRKIGVNTYKAEGTLTQNSDGEFDDTFNLYNKDVLTAQLNAGRGLLKFYIADHNLWETLYTGAY